MIVSVLSPLEVVIIVLQIFSDTDKGVEVILLPDGDSDFDNGVAVELSTSMLLPLVAG